MASSDDELDRVDGLEGDLFGSDEDEPVKVRVLSDRELDSEDDEDRDDRAARDVPEDADEESRNAQVLDTSVWRHPLPKPADGELNTLRLPMFLGIDPKPYDAKTFKPPTTDHHSETASKNFTASATSASTMRFRTDPTSGKLQSNTIVYKWSDGSSTIAIGDQHYELQAKPLAPPADKTYQEVLDSHSYFASPSIVSQMLVIVGHMTNQFTVRPNKDIVDDALEKLQLNLAAATRRGKTGDAKGGPELITNTIDPELQKKRAEMAEKERLKAQRRRETAAEKANVPRGYAGARGGLNVDDLEGRGGRRAPGAANKPRAKPKRRAEYDSDDDLPRGGRGREDEYDKEDDFLASSDEEEEAEGDDDDEEEMLDDESDRGPPKAKKQKISKRDEASDADEDAEADLDDEDAPMAQASNDAAARGRKRNVIEDDDDE